MHLQISTNFPINKRKFFHLTCFTLLFGVGGLFAVFSIWKLLLSLILQDFTTYYTASQDFLHHQNPYTNLQNTYIYPPGSLYLIAPIAFVGYSRAVIIWSILSLIALITSLLTITWMLFKKRQWLFFFLLFVLSWPFFPLKFNFGMGQINVILFCLCICSFFFWKYRKDTIGGAILGVAITLKLFPLFFVFFFIRKKSWRFLLSAFITFCLLNGIIFLWFGEKLGYQILMEYFTHIIILAV